MSRQRIQIIDDVICTNTKLLEAAFLPTYPDPALWSSTFYVQIDGAGVTVAQDPKGACPLITEMQRKSHVFDTIHQKQLLSEYNQKSKLMLQE